MKKMHLGLLVLLTASAVSFAGSADTDAVYATMGEAIDAAGFDSAAIVSIEPLAQENGVAELLVREVHGEHQAYVYVATEDELMTPVAEEYHFSPSNSTAKDYPGGEISYDDCEWGVWYSASRPSWAQAWCPYGKILAGWECYWDSNQTENENIRVYPNRIECRYRDNGNRAYARAYCCRFNVL